MTLSPDLHQIWRDGLETKTDVMYITSVLVFEQTVFPKTKPLLLLLFLLSCRGVVAVNWERRLPYFFQKETHFQLFHTGSLFFD